MMGTRRAIFFDLGGTLFSNLEILRVSVPLITEAAQRLDLDGGISEVGAAFVAASRRANARYVKRPFYLHRDLFRDTCRYFAESMGREASEEFLEWFYHRQREIMIHGPRLRDDCLETLGALRERGLALSIVSNIDDDYMDPMVRRLGLSGFFDHCTSSQEAASCKPDPGIFHCALRKADCAIEEVLFVGDSRVHDIQGACEVGMSSVLIAEEGGASYLDDEDFAARPDHVIAALAELIGIVDA